MRIETYSPKNIVVIQDDASKVFVSYDTNIAKIEADGRTVLDRGHWDYSRTTIRFLCQFLGITGQGGKRLIQERLHSQEYVLEDLNPEK